MLGAFENSVTLAMITHICDWGHSFSCQGCWADSCVRIVCEGAPFSGLGFVIPALHVFMAYDSFDFSSHRPLFQAFLHAICSHSGQLRFTWTRAHADNDMNNHIDLLAKQGLLPHSPALIIADLYVPPQWVDSGPILNNQSLAFLTDTVVASSPPPFQSAKFSSFFSSWSSWMLHSFSACLDPVAHIPHIWKADIPIGLHKLLYKHVLSSLPLGQTWHGKLALRQVCCCGVDLSLDHLWTSCPSYNLDLLLLTLYSCFLSLHHGTGLSAKPWLWPSPIWYLLLAFCSLDNIPTNAAALCRTLSRTWAKREWALGSFLWFIWKQHMKEVHDSSYCFIPELHVNALSATLYDDPTLASHPH